MVGFQDGCRNLHIYCSSCLKIETFAIEKDHNFPLRQNDQGGRICHFKEGECHKSSSHSEGQVRQGTKSFLKTHACAYMELFKALALGYRIQSHFYKRARILQERCCKIAPLFCSCLSIVGCGFDTSTTLQTSCT